MEFRQMTTADTTALLIRLRNPLMLLKGDHARAADLIEQLQSKIAELEKASA